VDEKNVTGVDPDTLTYDIFGYTSRTGLGTGADRKWNGEWRSFYSDMTSFSFSLKHLGDNYHFYGNGTYPSYFGGTVNSSGGYNYAQDIAASDAYRIVLKGGHSLIAGLEVTFKVVTANTGAATLQVNSLTATALTKVTAAGVNVALATGDIIAGQIVKAVYDGTQFQIISRLAQ
jgi:hypothetical protein